MSGHTVEEIRKETRTYLIVFAALAVLTVVTVAVSYLKLSVGLGIAVALAIASVKGFLVAGFFMHLFSERKLLYSILLVTVLFFGVLLWGPWHHWYNSLGVSTIHEEKTKAPPTAPHNTPLPTAH
ncbi:MAG TPA: cytochrome C oxidase subunit IV family protein [Thermoanaerobaculia bacterium]|nr:cytochrome C oxidase subunit IV family protein [Thermoanaerobaculia bacterium]